MRHAIACAHRRSFEFSSELPPSVASAVRRHTATTRMDDRSELRMKLQRPYIPIRIRIKVASRQLRHFGASDALLTRERFEREDVYLDRMLTGLSLYLNGNIFQPLHLDHDPALCNRKFFQRTMRYEPAANDPRYLIYRTEAEHDIKTRVRGDGAQLSDLALRRKFKRIEKRKREGKR